MKRAGLLLLALAGCGKPSTMEAAGAGARIEASAIATGMVADPGRASLIGSWARESDRMCVVAGEGGHDRIGLALDYGDGQVCAARGTVERHGDRLDLTLGGCRVTARFEGDRIVLPAEVPAACDRLCTGRASLAALAVDRQSESAADAAAIVGPDGTTLCRR